MCVCVYEHVLIYIHTYIERDYPYKSIRCSRDWFRKVWAFMYVYMHVFVCVYGHVCMHVHTYIHTYIHTGNSSACMAAGIWIQTNKEWCLVYMHVHTYIHTYIYTHTQATALRAWQWEFEYKQTRNDVLYIHTQIHIHTYIHTHRQQLCAHGSENLNTNRQGMMCCISPREGWLRDVNIKYIWREWKNGVKES